MSLIFVYPHLDDETLGADGTILKYKNLVKKIYWLNVINIKEKYGYSKEVVEKRNDEIKKVNKIYGFDRFFNLELEPANLDSYKKNELIGKISSIISDIKPESIIVPYREDIHSDHKVVFDCVYSCTKIFRYQYIKKYLQWRFYLNRFLFVR